MAEKTSSEKKMPKLIRRVKDRRRRKSEETEKKSPSLRLFVVICERGDTEGIVSLIHRFGVNNEFLCSGEGTANNEILELLGLGSSKKTLIFCELETAKVRSLAELISNYYADGKPYRAVAFTVPLSSIGGSNVLQALIGKESANGKDSN